MLKESSRNGTDEIELHGEDVEPETGGDGWVFGELGKGVGRGLDGIAMVGQEVVE